MTFRFALLVPMLLVMLVVPVGAVPLNADAINNAQWQGERKPDPGEIDPLVVKVQVLLDRAYFSPGEIDGKLGENLQKALAAFAASQTIDASDGFNDAVWQKLSATSSDPAVIAYTLSKADVAGPFVKKIPAKLEDMRHLRMLSYTSAREKIAEQFHLSPELLSALNPKQSFGKAGDTIMVTNVGRASGRSGVLPAGVARITVDKDAQTVRALDTSGKLIAFYPATIGSDDKPTPNGTLKVTMVRKNPFYRYNPDYKFKGVKSRKPFLIKPGPNNPVGAVWIGLSAEGYGIHGTPEPAKVSKTESHGCVRLTNWDALQLARATRKGVPVDFGGEAVTTGSMPARK